MEKKHLCSMLLLASTIATANASTATAQDTVYNNKSQNVVEYTGPLNIFFDTRIDYQREYLEGDAFKDNCGFKGKYFMLTLNGNINNRFSYTWRQRLNVIKNGNSFFDGTDKLMLTYKITPKWEITGGKFGMYFGSWEYDRNPIYIYNYSEWTNHIGCYKFGAMLTYNATENDHIYAQFMESPFNGINGKEDMYSYHLTWYGFHDWIETTYSANMLEYTPGNFMYYLCLGNRLKFGKATLELDIMNRASSDQNNFFFKDYSIIGELAIAPTDYCSIFAKGSYTVNNTNSQADLCVHAGTELTQLTGGVEFFPLKENKSLRLHAMYGYNWGNNTNPNGIVKDDQHVMSVGMLWQMDMVDLAKKIWKKTKK